MAENGYIGRQPNDTSTVIARQQYVLTADQDTFYFLAGYDTGYVDVYMNGVRLAEGRDFVAGDGQNVVLNATAEENDIIEVIAYKAFNPRRVVNFDNIANGSIGIQSAGTLVGAATTLNFIGAGNTFLFNSNPNGNIIDISISSEQSGYADRAGIATYAEVAGIATVAEGLTGTPDIAVRNVTGGISTFSGNVTVGDGGGVQPGWVVAPGFGVCNDLTGSTGKSIYFNYGNGGIAVGDSNVTTSQNIYLESDGNARFTGVVTATTFDGNATGLSGSPSVTVNDVTARHGNYSGVVTAVSFSGSGANLTGIDATALKDSGGNIKIQANESGAVVTGVLTAASGLVGPLTGNVTGNLTGNADTATSATTATNAQGLTGTPDITVGSITASSGSISGNLTIDGTLTYEDVTNVDAVGVITARQGVKVPDNQKYFAGSDDEIQLYHDTASGRLTNTQGSFFVGGSRVKFTNAAVTKVYVDALEDDRVELFYANATKLQTTTDGVVVTGVCTATSFSGDGSALTNLPSSGASNGSSIVMSLIFG